MPITDYSKTIIYKIVCNDLNVKNCYVGHTINMTKRKCVHKSICHNEKNKAHNLKIYQIIRENGGWGNWSMILVETFPCKDKFEACKREREIFEELDAKLNMVRPYLTQEENKENNKQYTKQYREDHKEKIEQYKKQYREDHKEEIKQYKKKYREDHKEYYKQYDKKYWEEHKEDKKQYDKKYREEHKAEIHKKIECEYCKKRLSNRYIPCHIKICKSKE